MPMMNEGNAPPLSRPLLRLGPDAAKMALAAGGMLAAFGVASCCALPIALSLLGLSAASLIGIGYLAAQYEQPLFYTAVVCLSAAGLVMWRQARSCGPGAACARPVARWTSSTAVGLGLAFLALTFWYAPPV